MEQFVYDIYSIFFQLLQHVAPEYAGEYGFLLACYICAAVSIVITIWVFAHICGSLASACLKFFYRG